MGARLTQSNTETEAEPIAETIQTGRPLVQIMVNGTKLQGFVDTGSEVTLLKSERMKGLNIRRQYKATRVLKGVSGKILPSQTECDVKFTISKSVKCQHRVSCVPDLTFPGDILLGMDLLRRFNYELVHSNSPHRSYLALQGTRFPVVYTDEASLHITIVSSETKISQMNAHVLRTVTCPPHSAMFVPVRVPRSFSGECALVTGIECRVLVPRHLTSVTNSKCNVYVVNPDSRPKQLKNGFRIATVTEVHEVVTPEGHGTPTTPVFEEYPEEREDPMDESTPPGGVFGGDDFDRRYGIMDFGYNEDEFTIFPEVDPGPSEVNVCSEDTGTPMSLDHLDPILRERVKEVLNKYPRLFSGDKYDIGTVPNITHRIITTETRPVCNRQWRLPASTKAVIRQECEDMMRAGVIEPSSSPWLSPVVLVRKRDGTVRFCIDYRGLNSVTVADSHPLPRIDELLDELGDTSYFTLLDSRSAYWSINVDPQDRPKTAFSDGNRLYQFRRLPFGLSGAPTTYQRVMNVVLSSVLGKHTLAYLDDVLVYSKTFEDHLVHLDETLTLLNNAGMKLNMEKCEIAKHKIRFLGFQVSAEGVVPDPEKVTSIQQMPAPANPKEVRRFLGATGFFRRHIPRYADVAAPLTRLTRKDVSFVWTSTEEAAFQTLKELLTSAPVLRQPSFDKPFEIHTDASKVAIGACLMQRDKDDSPYAIAYFSRKLKDAESRYAPIDLEALAVVEGVRVFDPYVYGHKFVVYTDHRPLTYVFSRRTKSPRMSRFAHELSFYNYRLVYKQGASHHVPDLLSRAVDAVDIHQMDPKVIREAQLQDPLWKEVMLFLEEKKLPARKLPLFLDEFELQDGTLYHTRHLPDRIIHQLVVPKALRSSALHLSHAPPIAAHPGVYRTYCNLRGMFYFPNMLREVKEYVKSCPDCQRRKGSTPRHASLKSFPEATHPLERVSADLIDLVGSSTRHRYVLVIIDHFSRFLQLVPLRRKDAESVTEAFIKEYVTLFGPPRALQTDNGTEFTNNLFSEVCKLLSIRTAFTTAYYPQANGLVERSNRVIKDALATLVQSRPAKWPEYLPQVRLALNTAIHRSTGEQPLYLLTGHHTNFPIGPTNQVTFQVQPDHTIADHLRVARGIAVEASRRAREGWARTYDKKVRGGLKTDIGTLVMRKNNQSTQGQAGGTLKDRWIGPSRITKRIGPVVFMVEDLQEPFRTVRCHINQLKNFFPREELEFADEWSDAPAVGEEAPAVGEEAHAEGEEAPDSPDPWEAALLSVVRPQQL